jgi:hypothetical protein
MKNATKIILRLWQMGVAIAFTGICVALPSFSQAIESDERATYFFKVFDRIFETSPAESSLRRTLEIDGFSDLVLSRRFEHSGESIPVWTNSHPKLGKYAVPALSEHRGYAAKIFVGGLFVCYKEGPILYAEHISHPAHKPRERFWLARDSGAENTTWTNAFFAYDTNAIPNLTAISSRGGRLSWQLTNSLWVLNPKDCAPTNLIAFAWQDWCVVSFQSNRWSVVLKNTDLPGDLSRNQSDHPKAR